MNVDAGADVDVDVDMHVDVDVDMDADVDVDVGYWFLRGALGGRVERVGRFRKINKSNWLDVLGAHKNARSAEGEKY